MALFLKLTHAEDRSPVYINMDLMYGMRSYGDVTHMHEVGGDDVPFAVHESPDEIIKRVNVISGRMIMDGLLDLNGDEL